MTSNQENSALDSYDKIEGNSGPQRGAPESPPQANPECPPQGNRESSLQGNPESLPQEDPQCPPREDPESPPQGDPESSPQGNPESLPQEDPEGPPQQDHENVPQADPECPPHGALSPQGQAYLGAPGVHPGPGSLTGVITAVHPGPGSLTGVITAAPKVGKDPVMMECWSCREKITTKTETSSGAVAWNTSGGMFLAGFLLCGITWLCCCFPFCISSMLDTTHHCPNCGNFIGKHRAFLD